MPSCSISLHMSDSWLTLISCALLQATNARHYEEKDARLEYLSWRVWFMKRNRARVKREDAATLAAEQVTSPYIGMPLLESKLPCQQMSKEHSQSLCKGLVLDASNSEHRNANKNGHCPAC